MSKFSHDAKSCLPPEQVKALECLNDPILGLNEKDLENWLDENIKNTKDTKDFLKRLTMIVACLKQKK